MIKPAFVNPNDEDYLECSKYLPFCDWQEKYIELVKIAVADAACLKQIEEVSLGVAENVIEK